jgi:hypothetical protein
MLVKQIMNKLIHISTLLLVLSVSVSAQTFFEGRLKIVQTNYSGGKKDNSTIDIFVTPNRIKVESNKRTVNMQMLGTDDVSEVLIRLDMEDLVIHSKDMNNEALKISKADIEAMMNMVKNMAKQFGGDEKGINEPKVTLKVTKETKKIAGYKSVKTIVTSSDDPNQELHVWLSTELNVNLGMLAEDWDFLDTIVSGSNKWLKKGEFPMAVYSYKKGTLVNQVEISEVKKGKVEVSKIEVPKNVRLLSFQDLLMKRMMNGN